MTDVDHRGDLELQRAIDLGIGIVMGLRRCSERDAFDDLVNAVHETGVGPAGLADALAHLVAGTGDGVPHGAEAALVWGHLLTSRATPAH